MVWVCDSGPVSVILFRLSLHGQKLTSSIKIKMWHWAESSSSHTFFLSQRKTIFQKLPTQFYLISHKQRWLCFRLQVGRLAGTTGPWVSLLLRDLGYPGCIPSSQQLPKGQTLAWNWHTLVLLHSKSKVNGAGGILFSRRSWEGVNIYLKVIWSSMKGLDFGQLLDGGPGWLSQKLKDIYPNLKCGRLQSRKKEVNGF